MRIEMNRRKFQMAIEDIRDFLVAFSIVVALIALAYVGLSILSS